MKRNRPVHYMTRRNRLAVILSEFGLEQFRPSDTLLDRLNMERRRFFQIMENRGKNEITVIEKENLEHWLAELTNQPVAKIQLMEQTKAAAFIAKHGLS